MKKLKKAPKKKNKRNSTKFPGLDPAVNLKTRIDQLDMDYINKLSEKDKKWLNKFCNEYVHASLDSKNLKKNLHNTKELKKDCYDRNNARNRDVYTKAKASGNLAYSEDVNIAVETDNIEDYLIEGIDSTLGYLDDLEKIDLLMQEINKIVDDDSNDA